MNDKLSKLAPQQSSAFERYIIKESEDELKRSRKWRRIFPTETCHKYKNYFEQDRQLNILLRNHEADKNKGRRPPNTFL